MRVCRYQSSKTGSFAYLVQKLGRLIPPKRVARVISKIMTDASGQAGVYYDEGSHPMQGSALVHDPKFQDRVVAETRALLSTIPK
jgi:hypothetical protein